MPAGSGYAGTKSSTAESDHELPEFDSASPVFGYPFVARQWCTLRGYSVAIPSAN